MAENEKILSPAEKAFTEEKAKFTPIPVTRNGVSLSFSLQRQEKGPTPDAQFLYPDDVIPTDKLLLLMGVDVCQRVLNIKFKKGMKSVFANNIKNHNGKLDIASFALEAAEYPFVNISKASLLAQQNELVAQLIALDTSTEDGAKASKELLAKIRVVNTAIADKTREPSEDEDEDEDEGSTVPQKAAASS